MAVSVKNLSVKNGTWKFRKSIPNDLRPFIEGGITEFVRVLGKGPSPTHEITANHANAVQECEALISDAIALKNNNSLRVEQPNAIQGQPLNAEWRRFLLDWFVHIALEESEEARFSRDAELLREKMAEQVAPYEKEEIIFHDDYDRQKAIAGSLRLIEELRRAYAKGYIPSILTDQAKELCEDFDLVYSESDREFLLLQRDLISKAIIVVEAELQRRSGAVFETPPEPLAPKRQEIESQVRFEAGAVKPQNAIAENGMTLRQLADVKQRAQPVGNSAVEATETSLRLFENVYGQRGMDTITRREVSDWKFMLQQKPTRVPAADKDLPLSKIIEKFEGRTDVQRLSGKTVNGHVSALNALWMWARKNGYVDRQLDNPFSEQRVDERSPELHPGFTKAQLQAIFNLPVFTAGERPKRGRGEACFWVPLLLLQYGARPEEMCQLLVSDIRFNEEVQEWTLLVTDEGTHPVKGERHLKSDGSPSVRRALPLTKTLIDLGFLDYVEHLKAKGQQALFPALSVKGKRGYLYPSVSEWWGEYLRENGAIPESGNKPLRGFRDAWTTAAARSGLTEEEREWIQGHYVSKGKTSNRLYGVRDFGKKVHNLQYDGLDLSLIKPWKPN